jgi:hypothetical protein
MKYEQYYDLGDRVPELAATYKWVKPERQKEAKRKGMSFRRLRPHSCHVKANTAMYRSEHGIALLGAVLPLGAAPEGMMLLEKARECCDDCANLASDIVRQRSSGAVDRK